MASIEDLDRLAGFLLSARSAVPAGEAVERLGGWSAGRLSEAVSELQRLGADVAETPQGLSLPCADPLDPGAVAAAATRIPAAGVEVRRVCASTNDFVRAGDGLRACAAEVQTAGRGRRGRSWLQPFATGLALSLGAPADPERPEGLAIALAVAVADALASAGYTGVGLKWPNDLQVGDQKVGGLLVEATGHPRPRIVVGLGLNVYAAPAIPGREAAALEACGPGPSRSRLAGLLADALAAALESYERYGLAAFAARYADLDVLVGRRIRWSDAGQRLEGVARGIAEDGALIVESAGGPRRCLAGDVAAVRPVAGGGQ